MPGGAASDEFKIIHKLPSKYEFTNQKENGRIQDPILLETISSEDDKKSSILIESSKPLLGTLFKPSGIKRLISMVLDEQIGNPTEDEFVTTLDNNWREILNPLTRQSIFSQDKTKRKEQIKYYWEHLWKGTEDDGGTVMDGGEPHKSARLAGSAGGRRKRTRRKSKRPRTKMRKTKRRKTKRRKTKKRRKSRRRKYK